MVVTPARTLVLLLVAALAGPTPAGLQPRSPAAPPTFVSLSAGRDHTCAVTGQGTAFCWGSNAMGALGADSGSEGCDVGRHRVPCSTSPIPVGGALVFTSITAGGDHSCGVTAAGAAHCWGSNGYGVLGVGFSGPPSLGPVAAASGLVFQSLSAGNLHTCGVTTSGQAFCWGHAAGLGTDAKLDSFYSVSPVPVAGGLVFKAVSAGWSHTCGVTTSGKAYCWGQDGSGRLGGGSTAAPGPPVPRADETPRPTIVAVAGNLVFDSLSAGPHHTCGVTTSGSAYCWGLNNHGQLGNGSNAGSAGGPLLAASSPGPVAVAGGLAFRSVSAGGYHSCGVTTAGLAYCWGLNRDGSLGVRPGPDSAVPVAVSGGLTFESVAAGWNHTCGVTSIGAVHCWGLGRAGVLGASAGFESCPDVGAPTPGAVTPCSGAPVPLRAIAHAVQATGAKTETGLAPKPPVFTAVSAGGAHTCALMSDGDGYCWGSNSAGQLGHGSAMASCEVRGRKSACSASPLAIAGGLRLRSITAGGSHACGVTSGGAAHCWGSNGLGELGNGFSGTVSVSPGPVVGGLGLEALAAGASYTCGITGAGAAYCWGSGQFGQLGDGKVTPDAFRSSPVPVTSQHAFRQVASGQSHSCGIARDDHTYCWGYQGLGPLGDIPGMRRTDVSVHRVDGGLALESVVAGNNHACGIGPGGAAYCWGGNDSGQLGDGSTTERDVPVRVAGGIAFESLSAGASHTCGVAAGGAAFCWGGNRSGQLGVGSALGSAAPVPVPGKLAFRSVSAGTAHTCGLTVAGVLYCWGSNVDGRLGTSAAVETCGQGIGAAPCSTTPVRVTDPP